MKTKTSILALSIITTFGVYAEETARLDQRLFETKIIDGQKSDVDAWPFMTAIVSKGQSAFNGQFCGGSFIGDKYVLTAAHCIDEKNPENLDVIIGIHDLNLEATQGQRVAVKNIYAHEQYSTVTLNKDIAILELERSVAATPVTLDASRDTLAENDSVTVMGWGNQQSNPAEDSIYPNELFEVSLPVVNQATCKASGGSYSSIDESTLCAGYEDGGKDSCQGDSGGPLVFDNNGIVTQVGVVSWGEGCAQPNKYGVYANVAHLKSWIDNQTNGHSYRQNIYSGYMGAGKTITQVLSVENSGAPDFTVTGVTLPDSGALNVVSNECENIGTLTTNQSCNITVEFTSALGANGETLIVNTDSTTHPALKTTFHSYGLAGASDELKATVSTGDSAYSNANPWVVFDASNSVLKSGQTPLGQSSIMMLDNLPAGKLSVESRMAIFNQDSRFKVYVNNERIANLSSNDTRWYADNINLTESTNSVMFAFERSEDNFSNLDSVYLRNIKHVPTVAPDNSGSTDSTGTDEATTTTVTSSSSSSSGGSVPAWLVMFLLPLAVMRRK